MVASAPRATVFPGPIGSLSVSNAPRLHDIRPSALRQRILLRATISWWDIAERSARGNVELIQQVASVADAQGTEIGIATVADSVSSQTTGTTNRSNANRVEMNADAVSVVATNRISRIHRIVVVRLDAVVADYDLQRRRIGATGINGCQNSRVRVRRLELVRIVGVKHARIRVHYDVVVVIGRDADRVQHRSGEWIHDLQASLIAAAIL